MERIYLIGPVSGKRDCNRKAFESVRKMLQDEGYVVDIPHDFIKPGTNWKDAMLVSIHQITVNAPIPSEPPHYTALYDGVATLDGWEQSRGARIEHALASELGIECKPWMEYL